jgi:hypothetical protein
MEVTGAGGIVLLVAGGLVAMFAISYLAAWFADRYSLGDWLVVSAVVIALLGLIGLGATTVEYRSDGDKGRDKSASNGRAARN